MSLVDTFLYRPLRKNVSVYQSDEPDSGFPSSRTSSCYGLFKNELKNEIIRSEKRRSALADSLKNACHAIEYQKNCLEQRDRYITSSELTLESLLMRQELLDSRLSNLKYTNFYPDVFNLGICEKEEPLSTRYPSEVTNNRRTQRLNRASADYRGREWEERHRINALEREIIDIKEKMRSCGSIWPNKDVYTRNVREDGKGDDAEAREVHEGLRRHSEVMAAKCSSAQQERDVLELQIASLHSGLHQANLTSKRLEKECVTLQSQVAANRNINEDLHLEVSALKRHNHTLESAVKGSERENKSLHVQVKSLQSEKQILASQKELMFEIMKKKEKRKCHSGKQTRRTPELIPTYANSERSYISTAGRNSFSESTQTTTSKHSRKKRKRKDKKYDSRDQKSSESNDCQMDCERKFIKKEKVNKRNKEAQNVEENGLNVKDGNSSGHDTHRNTSKRSELNTDIIVACYQHLADLLSKLECLQVNNVGLDKEKEQILKFILRTIQKFQDCRINSESSREQVEGLLDERMDLRKKYHKTINQVTAVIIELNHLRQAYNAVLRHSQDPDDKKAIQWISRVQAIKDSLKLLQEEQNLNP